MIRQAISPRLAISRLRNIGRAGLAGPRRRALFQERDQAFLRLGAGATGGDTAGRVLDHRRVDGAPGKRRDQRLGQRPRGRGAKRANDAVARLGQRLGIVKHLMHEPNPQRSSALMGSAVRKYRRASRAPMAAMA